MLRRLWRSVRGLSDDPIVREIDEELRFHIEMRADANERAGMDPAAARTAAERSFGDRAKVAEMGRELLSGAPPARDGAGWFDTLTQDVRFGLRVLRGNPITTIVAVLSLGLGIGANAANFSIVYSMLHRSLPFAEGERLAFIDAFHPNRGDGDAGVTWADMGRMQESGVFSALAAYDERSFTLAGQDFPERIPGASITPNLFATLGVEPQLGRGLTEEDAAAYGFEQSVVISDALWERRFARADDILGRTMLLNDRELTVVGVMPDGFLFPHVQQLWVAHSPEDPSNHAARYMRGVGRLAPGISLDRARQQLRGLATEAERIWPDTHDGWTLRGMSLRHGLLGGDSNQLLYIMFAAVGLVLLLACANVANLQLSRAPERIQEFVVRSALGGSRTRLLRQLLTESILLGLAGGFVGLVIARIWIAVFLSMVPEEMPFWIDLSLDLTTLVYTTAIAVGTAVLFGLLPALRIAGRRGGDELRPSARGLTAATQGALRNGLVAAQLALAVVLLVGAVLTVGSFLEIQNADPGFDIEPLLSLRMNLAGDVYDDPAARARFFEQVRNDLDALPQVAASAATTAIPADDGGGDIEVVPVGGDWAQDDPLYATVVFSTAGFFNMLDVPFLDGRDFTAVEAAQGDRRVVVIAASLAELLWPGTSAVGEQVRFPASGNVYDVVGVVPDIQYEEFGEDTATARLQIHVPYSVTNSRSMAIMVRAVAGPATLVDSVREVLRNADPGQAPYNMMTMTERRAFNSWGEGLTSRSFGTFGAIAMVLAVFGVYAVIAHAVSRRTREIGVRIALGARPTDVTGSVMWNGARLALVGVGLGALGGWGVARLLSGLLYGVAGQEPWVLVGVCGILGAAAIVASLIPARRAAGVDPTEALRAD